jgi:glycosyltransferase involved in cell wall biosynthesis
MTTPISDPVDVRTAAPPRPEVPPALDAVGELPGRQTAPLVSIVIPCYSHARFLGEAIESARSQTYRRLEVIVVDDGSPDDLAAIVARYPDVRYVSQENRGLAEARNTGLRQCRGELVVFLDADDRLLPAAVETGVRLLNGDCSLGFAAGHSRFVTSDGSALPTEQPLRGPGDPYLTLLRRNSIRNPAMVMFRRTVLEQVGGFDARVNACADYEIYLRISRSHPVRFHDAVVAEYRKHGANMSSDAALMIRELQVVIGDQRQHLRTPAHREAFRAGRRNIQAYYGDRLATQIRERLRTRSGWAPLAADVMTLVRCHPRGAVEHVCRKILCWWRGVDSPAQLT